MPLKSEICDIEALTSAAARLRRTPVYDPRAGSGLSAVESHIAVAKELDEEVVK